MVVLAIDSLEYVVFHIVVKSL